MVILGAGVYAIQLLPFYAVYRALVSGACTGE
jgi:hypothetical protein